MNLNKISLVAVVLFVAPLAAMESQSAAQTRLQTAAAKHNAAIQKANEEMIGELHVIVNGLEKQLQDAVMEKAAYEKRISELEAENDALARTCKKHEGTLAAVNEKNEKLQAAIDALKKKCEKAKMLIANLRKRVAELEDKLKSLEHENDVLKQKNEELNDRCSRVVSESKRFQEILNDFGCENTEDFAAKIEAYKHLRTVAKEVVAHKKTADQLTVPLSKIDGNENQELAKKKAVSTSSSCTVTASASKRQKTGNQ